MHGEAEIRISLADALQLRKLRKRANGVDAVELTKGDPELRKKDMIEAPKDPWKLVSGGLVDLKEVRGQKLQFGDDTGAKSGSGGFASATNVMDTEKKMQEFIETELKKKRASAMENTTSPTGAVNSDSGISLDDNLYEIPENFQAVIKPVQEGNVTLSAGMLTAIPEVDLGISAKMNNIEETERAKREYLERKTAHGKPSQDRLPGQSYTASARWNHQLRHTRTDHMDGKKPHHATREGGEHAEKAVEASAADGTRDKRDHRQHDKKFFDKRNMSTDWYVMDQFKKRTRRY